MQFKSRRHFQDNLSMRPRNYLQRSISNGLGNLFYLSFNSLISRYKKNHKKKISSFMHELTLKKATPRIVFRSNLHVALFHVLNTLIDVVRHLFQECDSQVLF